MDNSKFNLKSEWKKFGIGLGIILIIIAVILLLTKKNNTYIYFSGSGIIAMLTALVFPVILKPLYIVFSYLGHYMGWVVTRVILTLLYYLVLTPTKLASLIVGKRFLQLGIKKEEKSYWIVKQSGEENSASYKNQF